MRIVDCKVGQRVQFNSDAFCGYTRKTATIVKVLKRKVRVDFDVSPPGFPGVCTPHDSDGTKGRMDGSQCAQEPMFFDLYDGPPVFQSEYDLTHDYKTYGYDYTHPHELVEREWRKRGDVLTAGTIVRVTSDHPDAVPGALYMLTSKMFNNRDCRDGALVSPLGGGLAAPFFVPIPRLDVQIHESVVS